MNNAAILPHRCDPVQIAARLKAAGMLPDAADALAKAPLRAMSFPDRYSAGVQMLEEMEQWAAAIEAGDTTRATAALAALTERWEPALGRLVL